MRRSSVLLYGMSAFLLVSPAPGGEIGVDESVRGAAPRSLALPRLAGEVELDGVPDEAAWAGAAVVDRFFENAPGEGEPPVSTVGLLAYDSRFLYVGVRCGDPDPAKLRAPWVERDRVSEQDLVQIDVDARDEGRWSMIFRVNPRGVQADGVFDETAGADDFSPDFHWESAARIGADGWTAEMRIPLSTLRYRPAESQTWRITFFRLYPRDYRYSIASIAVPRGSNCWLCHATRFTGITGLGSARSLLAAPFATASGADQGAGEKREQEVEAGADVKWLPGPNLAVDLALNPDFSQVESDAPQIAVNNRFALFYPEKRPFFLEGSDLWNSPLQAINTRTITEPQWGARLTGRQGDASYTLLAAGDRGGGSLILPGPDGSSFAAQPEDSTVVFGRFRRTFGRSSLGALATYRDGDGGYANQLGGVDLQWYPTASDRYIAQLLWSTTRDSGEKRADDHALFLRWERNRRHLGMWLQYDELGRDFRADSGFVPQTGVRHTQGYLEYNVYREGLVRQWRPRFYFDESREIGGGVVSRSPAVGFAIDGRVNAVLDYYIGERERAADGRVFSKDYWNLQLKLLPNRRVPYVRLTARWGDALDIAGSRLGSGADITLAVNVAVTDRLQGELSAERKWIDVPAERSSTRLFTATVSQARWSYTFTTRSFARLIGQWESLDRGSGANTALSGSALYGYRLNWQSIVYLGYGNEPAPEGERGRRQQVFLKLSYAFRPHFGRGEEGVE